MDNFRTIIEPFKIKMVERIRMNTRSEREEHLKEAHYNPFLLMSDEVIIDLLTDSGTSAMSAKQWGAMMRGDESYAGAKSFVRLEKRIKKLTGHPYFLPTHQGRAAERIIYGHLGGAGKTFISNTHFDTTRANIEFTGAEAIDCPTDMDAEQENFLGNMDTAQLNTVIKDKGAENIGGVILTVTNNSRGGQPVSMANAKEVAAICKKNGIQFILDCCRIAENAYFVKERESEYKDHTYEQIAREMLGLADIAVMSAKKDALVNMGGFLSMKDNELKDACTSLLIITEGYTTYGGLSGRDMEAMARGLKEVFHPEYLHYRIKSTAYLGERLYEMGIPLIMPTGGHAVYVDAAKLYEHIPVHEYPGQSLVCELYKVAGIRCVEIGSVMFGKYDDAGKLIPADQELVRLAIPRRVYTQSHIDYVIEAFERILEDRKNTKGYKIVSEPKFMRHFTAHFEPLI